MALRKRQQLKFMPGDAGDHRNEEAPIRLSLGSLLRAERERRNLSLDDVAANLRIRRALLDAIEHGRYKELPGAPYAVGFVRAYAEFLELDRDEAIRRFRAEAEGLESPKELNFPQPLAESRLPGGVLLLLSAVIAACAYAVWYFHSANERAPLPRVAAVPERLAPLAESALPAKPEASSATAAALPKAAPPQQAVPLPPSAPNPAVVTAADASVPAADAALPAVSAAGPGATQGQEPSAMEGAAPQSDQTTALTSTAGLDANAIPAAPADTPSQPRVYGEAGSNRIVIRATGDSWIQVRDSAGTVLFTRILRTGDVYNVPDQEGLFLYTGSAGALEISVDGRAAPPIGQLGAVRRDVLLDPDRLLAGTAVLDQRRPSVSAPTPPSSGG